MTRPSTPNWSGQWDLSLSGQYVKSKNLDCYMMEFIFRIGVISLVALIHVFTENLNHLMWMKIVFQDEVVSFESLFDCSYQAYLI